MNNNKKLKEKTKQNKVINKKQNTTKSFNSATKGITLIALIITIIVLLILAGVSIATLTGDNGVLTKAVRARNENTRGSIIDQAKLDIIEWQTEQLSQGNSGAVTDEIIKTQILNGKSYVKTLGETSFITTEGEYEISYSELYKKTSNNTPTGGKQAVPGVIVTGENADYTTEDGTAKIPVGFAIVPGLDDISEGLVITDEIDPETQESIGNEFVWIPVSQANFEREFIRRAGYYNGNPQDISDYAEEDGQGNNSKFEEIDSIHDEAIAMYDSVYDNEGFYIGRYETGFIGDEAKGDYYYYEDKTDANVVTEAAKLVVQKGAQVYNYVPWGAGLSDISAYNKGNDNIPKFVIGAVELARNFASVNGYDTNKVNSTLCYSVQWDTALNFIDPGYTGYAQSSIGMGWYSDNYNSKTTGNKNTNVDHITGKDLIYEAEPTLIKNKHKNIYDMGGNVSEWTMEACNTSGRAIRGGDYSYSDGSGRPASTRLNGTPYGTYVNLGFRLALYL